MVRRGGAYRADRARRGDRSRGLQLAIELEQPEQLCVGPRIRADHDRFPVALDGRNPGILGFEITSERLASLASAAITGQRRELFVAMRSVEHRLTQLLVLERLVDEPKDLALVDAVDRGV